MNSRLLYLSWLDSKDLYPANTPTDFVVQFNQPLNLTDQSQIELLEFSCEIDPKTQSSVCILSALCNSWSFVYGKEAPILRLFTLPTGKRKVHIQFNRTYKISCTQGLWRQCAFHIRDENLKVPSFSLGAVQITLRVSNELPN
jgi:hypothetical protein